MEEEIRTVSIMAAILLTPQKGNWDAADRDHAIDQAMDIVRKVKLIYEV